MVSYRKETDSMGEVQVPEDALYAAQTQRAVDNFQIGDQRMPNEFIYAVARIKRCAAMVNHQAGLMDEGVYQAISLAAEKILAGDYADQFPVDVFQTGSGTSTNMNVNEVLALVAQRHSGLDISPNDHVNMSQSSNDVIPTAIHLSAALAIEQQLLPALDHLQALINKRGVELKNVVKTGRTHLMDAMPVRCSQELEGWSGQLGKNRERLQEALRQLCFLSQGGTAVGTGVNTPALFAEKFCAALSADTGMNFMPNNCFFEGIASQDVAVAASGQLKTLAVTLMKISNDLRWMNSGPLAGLGEIQLPELQPGSSIMPGKVNPVIPEAVAMAAAQVMGNDACITIAGQSGNFQLNVMLPVIASNLLQSIRLMSNAMTTLADKAIAGFVVNEATLNRALSRNPILVTALNPVIGYLKSADIAKKAYKEGRPVIDVAEEMTDLPRAELEKMLDPRSLV